MTRLGKIERISLPAAGASALGGASSVAPGLMEIKISSGAAPALAEGKAITLKLKEGATEKGEFSDALWAGKLEVVGGADGGGSAASLRLAIPSNAKPWVKLAASVEAAGGDNTASFAEIAFYW